MMKGVSTAAGVLLLAMLPTAFADVGVAPPSEMEAPSSPQMPEAPSAPDAPAPDDPLPSAPEQPDPQRIDPNDLRDLGDQQQDDVDDNADGARREADETRGTAESEATGANHEVDAAIQAALALLLAEGDGALKAVNAASTESSNLLSVLLSTAEQAAGRVLAEALAVAQGLLGGGQLERHMAPPGGDELAVSTVSLGTGEGANAAALALVGAAGAVGGALLWWTTIRRLVLFGAIPLLSRIAHSEIYTNTARRLIADLVLAGPGVSLNELVSKTGYSRNAVSYHLFVLEKEEELVSIRDGKYRRYFPRGGKYVNGAKNVVSALRNETTLKMAQHIVANPGLIQRDLCRELGTTPSAACWHARRLEQLLIIRKERVANTVQYFPGEALAKYDLSEFGLANQAAIAAPAAVAPTA